MRLGAGDGEGPSSMSSIKLWWQLLSCALSLWATNMRYFACDRVIQFLKLVTENPVVMISYGKCINTSICFEFVWCSVPFVNWRREGGEWLLLKQLSLGISSKGRLSWICSSVSLVWHPRPERTCTSAHHWHTAWYYEPPFSPPSQVNDIRPPTVTGSPSELQLRQSVQGMRVTMMVACSAPHMHVRQQHVPTHWGMEGCRFCQHDHET